MKKQFKPFNLEAAKAGAKVVTEDGNPVRILCFDMKNPNGFELVGLVTTDRGNEQMFTWNKDGRVGCFMSDYAKDLRMAPEKREGWVLVFNEDGCNTTSEIIFDTREIAEDYCRTEGATAVAKIEWEE